MKLKYTQYIDSDEPVMLINKHIGMDEEDGEGIMGADFQSELMYLDSLGKKRIKVLVCSPGGSVMDGMMIYNSILATKTKVDTYNSGVAASIAGVICQAGRTRYMSDYALLMMHNPSTDNEANASPQLQAFKDSIIKMLVRKNPTMSEAQVSDLMNNTTWMNAEEAIKQGFVDVVENSSDMNKPRAVSTTMNDTKQIWRTYSNYFNSINTTKNESQMKKVTNKLKLVDGSTEEVILNAIEAIENNIVVEREAKDKIAGELKVANDDLLKAKNKVTELETAAAEAKIKEDAAITSALDKAADLAVTNYVKAGKIKNSADSIAAAKANFVKDFDGTTSIYEAMPLNVKGATVVDVDNKDTKATKYTMGAVMYNISNKTENK